MNYLMTAFWYPHEQDEWEAERGLPGHQSDPSVHEHPDLDSAERQGGQWGCMIGVRRVEVRSPDGELQALWDKDSRVVIKHRRYVDERGRMLYDVSHVSNHWQNVGEESKALRRRINAEIAEARRAEQADADARRAPGEPRRAVSSQAVVDRLRRTRATAEQTGGA